MAESDKQCGQNRKDKIDLRLDMDNLQNNIAKTVLEYHKWACNIPCINPPGHSDTMYF